MATPGTTSCTVRTETMFLSAEQATTILSRNPFFLRADDIGEQLVRIQGAGLGSDDPKPGIDEIVCVESASIRPLQVGTKIKNIRVAIGLTVTLQELF